MEKVFSTLKQFVRDWTEEGSSERKQCYAKIVQTVDNFYSHLTLDKK